MMRVTGDFDAASVLAGVATLGATVIIALLNNITKTLKSHGEKLVRFDTILTGSDGNNGMSANIRETKAKVDTLAENVQDIVGRVDSIDARHALLDRRSGDDRRHGTPLTQGG